MGEINGRWAGEINSNERVHVDGFVLLLMFVCFCFCFVVVVGFFGGFFWFCFVLGVFLWGGGDEGSFGVSFFFHERMRAGHANKHHDIDP